MEKDGKTANMLIMRAAYTVVVFIIDTLEKKFSEFPARSWNDTNQNLSGRVWLVTFRLRTGKWLNFFLRWATIRGRVIDHYSVIGIP